MHHHGQKWQQPGLNLQETPNNTPSLGADPQACRHNTEAGPNKPSRNYNNRPRPRSTYIKTVETPLFLNILKTKCISVRERVKNALSCSLLHLVFKVFKKKNFTFIKSAFGNNLRFFTNECTQILTTRNFGPQGPQNAALQQRYSPC